MSDMDTNIVLSGLLGFAMSALQLLLMRGVFAARQKGARYALLLLKLPLWALAFVGIAVWLGISALVVFGVTAGLPYLAVGIVFFLRTRKGG